MVAQEDVRHGMSVDEWRDLERTSRGTKHEYIDGYVYAMAGGTLANVRIGNNAVRALEDALAAADRRCYVYSSDAAARLSATRYTYPDATVTCDEHDRPSRNKTEIEVPRVVLEVLSDSTEAYDRGRKFRYYQACPHIQEYVLIATKYQLVEVYRREAWGWAYHSYGPSEEIELTSIEARIAVDALYRDAGVTGQADDPEGEV